MITTQTKEEEDSSQKEYKQLCTSNLFPSLLDQDGHFFYEQWEDDSLKHRWSQV